MSTVALPEADWPARTCQFVATPIGNLSDVTLRALAVLGSADGVYAEDTRRTGRLLRRYELSVPLGSYHDHNKKRQAPRIVARVAAGERIAVVSDAGMPCINDPGYVLIRALDEAGLAWTVVPGASSILAALVLSGLPPDRFRAVGYPPRKSGARERFLTQVLAAPETVIMLESVHRVRATLEQLAALAPTRDLVVVREITKVHEEVLRGTAGQLLQAMVGPRLKGELVLLTRGRDD